MHDAPLTSRILTLPNAELIPEIARLITEGHTVTFRVRGYSMRPFLEHERDAVSLSPVGDHRIRRGDVVLAEIAPRQYVLHRVERNEGGQLTLRGDGNVYGREQCREQDVVGLATAFVRKGRSSADSVTGLKWRLYSRLWPSNSLVRRILLGLHRRIFCK